MNDFTSGAKTVISKTNKVVLEWSSNAANIRLTAAESENRLTLAMLADLLQALQEANNNPDCRAIIVSGEGPAFCSGLHLSEAMSLLRNELQTGLMLFSKCLSMLANSSVPTVALIQGKTFGGGVGIAAACDLVIASNKAKFGLPEALIGLVPAMIEPALLRRMHPARFRSLALSTRTIGAVEAQFIGLVDEVVEEVNLTRAGHRQLRRLRSSSPAALQEIKQTFTYQQKDSFDEQLQHAVNRAVHWMHQEDAIAGMQAAASGELPPWWNTTQRQVQA